MLTTSTPPPETVSPIDVPWRAITAALFAALARLAVVLGAACCVVVILLNEIAAAIVYAIAAVLALFFWSC